MESESSSTIRIGLLGCGTVGGALARIIHSDAARIAARTGVFLEIKAVSYTHLTLPTKA